MMVCVTPVVPPRSPREIQIARDEWRGLGWKTRRQVARLARQGTQHPTPRVRSVALRWAYTAIPAKEPPRTRGLAMAGVVAWGLIVEAVLALLHLGADGAFLGGALGAEGNWRERRLAKRLLRLTES